jgi:prepilin-type N-terminal cleavage/methylation domain-containing protein/prepilin-type processing-associated H-X9-DG protein
MRLSLAVAIKGGGRLLQRYQSMAVGRRNYRAFTLVELLVVIAILGVLMALLMPAVGSARDAMRRMQCKNNLMQIGRGCQAHVTKLGYFPSSGWGWEWIGDPDRGYGARQPGGWLYNLLPFMGLDNIHDIGKGLPGDADPNGAKGQALKDQQTAAVPFFICPVRRKAILYPLSPYPAWNSATPVGMNKTDYAANGGSHMFIGTGPNPSNNCFNIYPNCAWSNPDQSLFDGVSGERSEVTPGQITDGLSNVFLAGEKLLNPQMYYTGLDGADNSSAFEGNDWDVDRWVTAAPMRDTPSVGGNGIGEAWFGSPHSQGVHFVFCDGSVKMISYQIDLPTYQSLGVRNDGTYSENF